MIIRSRNRRQTKSQVEVDLRLNSPPLAPAPPPAPDDHRKKITAEVHAFVTILAQHALTGSLAHARASTTNMEMVVARCSGATLVVSRLFMYLVE
ncbi:hypothetical protein L6452_41181 [Arctium lappa]|uniref:Uncharacterized protein n=1 Tax=Arctium lappa TaxID=4217 RepID=A0ACB8XMX4_ARCLA|nr:hypothetical protein L6452_41181 [Arctium lappa]